MGTAFVFGDNVDTDLIMPSGYDEGTLGDHCLEGLDPTFSDRFEPDDFIVGGRNFGCGSSRETAPQSILQVGAEAVIAESFARIFYRNAINIGLPVYEIPDASEKFSNGDDVTVDHESGVVRNETAGVSYSVASHPPFLQEILETGGLIAYGNRSLARDDDPSVRR